MSTEQTQVPSTEPSSDPNVVSMQADYTRKTQELARQRTELEQERLAILAERETLGEWTSIAQRLESDPQSTIEALSEAYGVTREPSGNEYGDPLDDVRAEMAEQKKFRQELVQEREQDKIERVLSKLETQYGTFDRFKVLARARATGINDLETVLLSVKQLELLAKETNPQTASEDDRNLESLELGSEGGGNNTPPGNMTMQEAWEAAKKLASRGKR